jgi:SSS family solute:Na+ symporter
MNWVGFHWLDILVIAVYFFIITYIGRRIAEKIRTEQDFFLAGRSMNKFFQFFLNMGILSDANSAIRTASFTFHKGLGGAWLMLIGVFTGPYYWFMAGWFRRVRLVTMAELFEERFKSKLLPSIYAVVGIWLSILIMGVGYRASLRTFQAMTIKPADRCSESERHAIEQYQLYRRLDVQYQSGSLDASRREEYRLLDNLYRQGRIAAYVSYTKPFWFYLIYTVFVGLYIVLGGLKAAAVTDTIQGVLIIVFSVILIPLSLVHLGGWEEFAARIPDEMLFVFGAGNNEFAWNSIGALAVLTLVGITGHQGNMSLYGAARDELTARIACVGGAYTKRLLTIVWALCGLFAYALFADVISDPDAAWGILSHRLLGPGLRGVMVAGILAANMSTLDAVCVYLAALFVRHLYKPFVPDKSQRHYVNVSRAAIVMFLLLGIYVSVSMTSIIHLIKALPSVNIIFGAPVLLLLFWRRLTLKAVYVQVIVCAIVLAVLPQFLPALSSVRLSDWLTQKTDAHTAVYPVQATPEDVAEGLAEQTGQHIKKPVAVPSAPIYFDAITSLDPFDPESPPVGMGRLHTELILAHWLGFNLRAMTPSGLLTVRYLIALILPFVLLIPISLLTHDKGLDKSIAYFYAKLKTPVDPDPQKDALEVQKSRADPTRFEHTKLFVHSNWEFCKWTRTDIVGFLISVAISGGILVLFWGLIRVIA